MSVFRFRQWGSALHRYLGLLAFGQVLLWSLSGFLMYSLDFSDLYREPPPHPLVLSDQTPDLHTLQTRLQVFSPGSQLLKLELKNLAGETVSLLSHTKGPPLLFSAAGERLSPLTPARVRAIALSQYQGKAAIAEVQLLPKSAGNYVSGVPVYRVLFGDDAKTEMYIDPQTGALLARRKALWALYNRMWEFHLMKYTPSQPLNKFLLLGFAVLNAVVALTGFMKFFRKKSAML
ncbi:MAG: PepSY domain-containing protein [Candidatus Sericytochromatia bacterium]